MRAAEQDEHQAGHHRRHRKWQVNKSEQHRFAAKMELGDGPRSRHPEHHVERDADAGDQQRQLYRRHGVLVGERFPVAGHAGGESLGKDIDERQQKEDGGEQPGQADQNPLDKRRFLGRGTVRARRQGGGAGQIHGR